MLRRARLAVVSIAILALLAPPPVAGATLSDVDFLIRAARHEDSNGGSIKLFCLSSRTDRTLSFKVLFPASAAYYTQNSANQLDWNKVMGITTLRIHHNSIRLGWRWLPNEQKMELGFYGYIRGTRIEQALAKVDPGIWTDCEMRLHGGGLMVRAGAARYERAQSLGFSSFFPTATFILKTAYFGGDETAPHDITVSVKDIVAN